MERLLNERCPRPWFQDPTTAAGRAGSSLAAELEDRPDAETQVLLRLVIAELRHIQPWREAHGNSLADSHVPIAAEQSREGSLIGEGRDLTGHVAVRPAEQSVDAGFDVPVVKQADLRTRQEAV